MVLWKFLVLVQSKLSPDFPTVGAFIPSKMKKNSNYFSHDYNSSDDHKCLFLRQQLGMEGYGIFWFLVEKLAQAGGSLPLKLTPSLAIQMQVSEAKVHSVIHDYELFDIHDFTFYSKRLNDHLEERKLLSQKGKEGNEKRWGKYRPPISLPNSDPNQEAIAPLIARKERKGNIVFNTLLGDNTLAITLEDYELEGVEKIIAEINQNPETKILTQNEKKMNSYAVVEMVRIFRDKNPDYFFDKETDYHACWQIAQNIAAMKKWKKMEAIGEKRSELLQSWSAIVDFMLTDSWHSTRSLSHTSATREWQSLVQKMSQKKTPEVPLNDYQRKLQEQLAARKRVV